MLLARLRVEHELQGLVIRAIAACIVYIWIHVKVPTAQLGEITKVRGLLPLLALIRVLRIRVELETLTLYHFPSLQDLICRWISSDWPLLHGCALSIIHIQLIAIIRQLCPTLESVPAGSIVDAIHCLFGEVLLDVLLGYSMASGENSILDLGLRVSRLNQELVL